jgi:hypothetical protein
VLRRAEEEEGDEAGTVVVDDEAAWEADFLVESKLMPGSLKGSQLGGKSYAKTLNCDAIHKRQQAFRKT